MAINFCQAHHSPIISNTHVCRDGYDVSNLISANQAVRRNGFCAEYFIKPPVEVVVEFPLPIDVSHILIGLKVGEQQTTGLEILSQYQPGNGSYDKDEQFVLIGKKFGLTANRVLFLNRFYSSREPFVKLSSTIPSVGVEVMQIQSKHYANVSSVKALRIRLVKTLGSSAPAISELEVWGQPARSCGETAVASVLKNEQWSLPSSSSKSSGSNKDRIAGTTKEPSSLNSKAVVKPSTTDEAIPSDFIDPLTCEIMTIPVLLPSGHTIDQLTLEKYCDTEASWGRLPNDPFTGLRFNNDHKPIQNLPLKTRIDQFVLRNGHLLKNLPRTVGGSNTYGKPTVRTSSLVNVSSNECSEKTRKETSVGVKRSLDVEDTSAKKQKQQENHKDIFIAEPCTSLDKGDSVSEESCDLRYSRNLDEALKATLSGYKSYTKFALDNGESEDVPPCCNVCLSDAILYRLSCLHLLCRECLVQKSRKTQVICDKCCKPSTVATIARVHV